MKKTKKKTKRQKKEQNYEIKVGVKDDRIHIGFDRAMKDLLLPFGDAYNLANVLLGSLKLVAERAEEEKAKQERESKERGSEDNDGHRTDG
jgi:hypothetical protein